ncbi:TetR/AcrR family transcriptional regulator [Hansschlegelia quercus]|uniref:TetR/AcrR family transcriptional regulator n=1 Tax=Hansschlegelia quercus TaxID=2528245 RepID=A0A4Q9GHH8_9HYPH|nr:TetR/AcrR family transcriptional regulator [Hansschlegelia quercus]TBN48588.1 TetR/AcrR family transcriptional regulator [Hansschlegelia quercus]
MNDPTPEPKVLADPRERIVDALFALLSDKSWADIGLYEIALRAGVSLSELRILFPSKGAILSGFVRKIDLEVLKVDATDLAGEPVRERIFDVLMRRFEALAPYRDALRKVRDGLVTDPLGAAAMNQVAVSSMQWMLAAASVPESGPFGTARAQALVLLTARVFRTFLNDPDEDLARTMKALDEELRKAERWAERADDLGRLAAPFRSALDRVLGRSTRPKPDDDVASAA